MRIITFLFLVLSMLINCSCKKKSENEYSKLIIKPKTLACSNNGVRVRLFLTELDYQNTTNAIRDVFSVNNEPVFFDQLEAKIYFFRLDKLCGAPVTNAWCDPSIRKYTANSSYIDHLIPI
jgi:hypothetical protein